MTAKEWLKEERGFNNMDALDKWGMTLMEAYAAHVKTELLREVRAIVEKRKPEFASNSGVHSGKWRYSS